MRIAKGQAKGPGCKAGMQSILRKLQRWFAPIRPILFDADGAWRAWTAPAALLVIAILSYGIYARRLGFYWDDWTFAWARYFRGLDGLKDTFFINRPMRSYFEILFDPIFGVNPFAWQVLGIVTRWAAAVALWWFLLQVWPDQRRVHFSVALFSLVYPGFTQQSIAMCYYYFWFFLAVFFLSLGSMVWGIRNPRRFWFAMGAAWIFSAAHLFASEYFFGLELLRPIFLWMALRPCTENTRQNWKRAILYYIPFVVVLGVYIYWRVFVYEFPSYQPVLLNQLKSAPLLGIRNLISQALTSFKVVTLDAWEKILQVPLHEIKSGFAILYPVIVIITLTGVLFYQNRSLKVDHEKQNAAWQMIVLGIVAILVAGLPFYLTGLPVMVIFEHDRLTMPFIFGVSLLLVGLLELLLRKSQSVAIVSCLVALAVGAQNYYALTFSNESELQNKFMWQLTWRAPDLKPDTLILSDDTTFPFSDDEALTFIINWTYSPESSGKRIAYAFDILSVQLGKEIPSLEKGVAIYQDNYSSAYFEGSTDQALTLYYAPPSCLRILNPRYDTNLVFQSVWWDSAGQPHLDDVKVIPALTDRALPLSNLNQIIPDPEQAAVPPVNLLGSEPPHTWCYYFEKADLARQAEDWQLVARLGDEAMVQHSLRPFDLSEYLIFIEADLNLRRWADARDLSFQIADWAPSMLPSLCAVWGRVATSIDLDGPAEVQAVQRQLQCTIP